MKNNIKIVWVTFIICLAALAAAGPAEAVTLHYTPVVSATGDQTAYVKRTYRYWASGGSIMPFLGGKPTKVRVLSDRIQVCVKDLKTGRVKVIGEWKPKQVKESGRLYIKPILNWDLEELRYVITIRTEKDPGVGIFRRPYAYLTNLEKWHGLEPGPTAAGVVRVRLDTKSRGRFPKDNNVVVETTWDLASALPAIQQNLDQLMEKLRATANEPAERTRVLNLSQFLAEQQPHRLPGNLVALFLDESRHATGTYPDLTPAVLQLGQAAIEPLLRQYDQSPPAARLATLALFGEIGSATALSLVRREIQADNPDIQSAAIVALRGIKGNRAGEELVLLLGDTRLPSPVRVTVLGQLMQTEGVDWPTHLLDTALQDPLVFAQLPDIMPDLALFPERLIWFRLSEIYTYLESENPRHVHTAQHLIARIRFWNHLSELGPVVGDLLKARYDYGRTTDASGNFIDTGREPTDNRVVWDRGLATDLLENIEEKLEHPTLWMARSIWEVNNLLKQLYLEELLYKRKGQRIINRPPVEAQFEVSIRDGAGVVQATGRRFAEVERPVTFNGEPLLTGFPPATCEGRLAIDKENWRLTFNPLVMRLEDRTLAVPVSIPFGGACEIKMETRRLGKPQTYVWTVRHIDAPRPRDQRRSKTAPSRNKRYDGQKVVSAN